MADIHPTPQRLVTGVETITWSNITTADTPLQALIGGVGYLASAVQAVGVFGGTTLTIQGSNNGTDWVTLKDTQGTDMVFTSAGAFEVSSSMVYIRPILSGGTGTDVTVIMSTRR